MTSSIVKKLFLILACTTTIAHSSQSGWFGWLTGQPQELSQIQRQQRQQQLLTKMPIIIPKNVNLSHRTLGDMAGRIFYAKPLHKSILESYWGLSLRPIIQIINDAKLVMNPTTFYNYLHSAIVTAQNLEPVPVEILQLLEQEFLLAKLNKDQFDADQQRLQAGYPGLSQEFIQINPPASNEEYDLVPEFTVDVANRAFTP